MSCDETWRQIEFDGERDSLDGRQIHCGDVLEMKPEKVTADPVFVRYEMADGEAFLVGAPRGVRAITRGWFRWPS